MLVALTLLPTGATFKDAAAQTMDPKALAYQIIGPAGEIVMRSENAREAVLGAAPSWIS